MYNVIITNLSDNTMMIYVTYAKRHSAKKEVDRLNKMFKTLQVHHYLEAEVTDAI